MCRPLLKVMHSDLRRTQTKKRAFTAFFTPEIMTKFPTGKKSQKLVSKDAFISTLHLLVVVGGEADGFQHKATRYGLKYWDA